MNLRCFFFASLLVKLGDELREVVNVNLQPSPGIPEIMKAGRTFREQNLCPCFIDDLSQAIPGDVNRILRGDTPKSAPCTAAHGVFSGAPRLHKVWRNLPDDLPRFVIDSRMTSQIAGVVVGYPLVGFYRKIEVFEKLGNMLDLDSEIFVRRVIFENP